MADNHTACLLTGAVSKGLRRQRAGKRGPRLRVARNRWTDFAASAAASAAKLPDGAPCARGLLARRLCLHAAR